jgi:hypothetical protein
VYKHSQRRTPHALVALMATGFCLMVSHITLAQTRQFWVTVKGNNPGWTTGPELYEGGRLFLSASGTVCCASPRVKKDKKCRQPSSRHAEGALIVEVPGYGTVHYADFPQGISLVDSGVLRFWVEDEKHEDNYGSYRVEVLVR